MDALRPRHSVESLPQVHGVGEPPSRSQRSCSSEIERSRGLDA